MTEHHHHDHDHYTGTPADLEPADPLILEYALALAPGRALDLGCGAGGLLFELAARKWQATGVDISKKAIAAARQIARVRGLEVELLVADASQWAAPERYDLVTNVFALPDARSAQVQLLERAKAAVAPGGSLLIKDMAPGMKDKHPAFAPYYFASLEELVEIIDGDGLNVVRAETVETPAHDHGGHAPQIEGAWTATFIHAKRS